MVSFNKAILAGNLTRDPELKYLQSGTAVCEFTLAINRQWKGQDGEKKEDVGFFDCVAWGRTAEVIAEHCKKGRPILVEGRLQQDRWEDQSGNKRSKVKVSVERMQFLGGRDQDGGRSQEGGPPASSEDVPADDSTPF